MDKSYQISNIKYTDNPIEGHVMVDLRLDNLQFNASALYADTHITVHGVGAENTGGDLEINAEGVDLTASGGGGGGLFKTVHITFINNSGAEKTATFARYTAAQDSVVGSSLQIPVGTTEADAVMPTNGYATIILSAAASSVSSGIVQTSKACRLTPKTGANESITWG